MERVFRVGQDRNEDKLALMLPPLPPFSMRDVKRGGKENGRGKAGKASDATRFCCVMDGGIKREGGGEVYKKIVRNSPHLLEYPT